MINIEYIWIEKHGVEPQKWFTVIKDNLKNGTKYVFKSKKNKQLIGIEIGQLSVRHKYMPQSHH